MTVEVAIPGTESGFDGRDAFVYLPPAWFADPPPALPVLVLAPGVPSQTSDWTRGGDADGTADAFAAANGGKAPILAMIDTNGSIDADTECVDGPSGKVETYVVQDVPAYLRSQFGASSAAGSLAIGGLSAGGTCALLVSLRNPTVYPTFADFSGYQSPELDNPADTSQNLFGGSTEAQQAHDPATLHGADQAPQERGMVRGRHRRRPATGRRRGPLRGRHVEPRPDLRASPPGRARLHLLDHGTAERAPLAVVATGPHARARLGACDLHAADGLAAGRG